MPLDKDSVERLSAACRMVRRQPLQFFYCEQGDEGDPVLLIGKRIGAEAREVRKKAQKKKFVQGELKMGEADRLEFHTSKTSGRFEKNLTTFFKDVRPLKSAVVIVAEEELPAVRSARDSQERLEKEAEDVQKMQQEAERGIETAKEGDKDAEARKAEGMKRQALAKSWAARAEKNRADLAAQLADLAKRTDALANSDDLLALEALAEEIAAAQADAERRKKKAEDAGKELDKKHPALAPTKELADASTLHVERLGALRERLLERVRGLGAVVSTADPGDLSPHERAIKAVEDLLADDGPLSALATARPGLQESRERLEALLPGAGDAAAAVEALLNRAEAALDGLLQAEKGWEDALSSSQKALYEHVLGQGALARPQLLALIEEAGSDPRKTLLLDRALYERPGKALSPAQLQALAGALDPSAEADVQIALSLIDAGADAALIPQAAELLGEHGAFGADGVLRILAEEGDGAAAHLERLSKLGYDLEREQNVARWSQEAEAEGRDAWEKEWEEKAKGAYAPKSNSNKDKRHAAASWKKAKEEDEEQLPKRLERAVREREKALLSLYGSQPDDRDALDERLGEAGVPACQKIAEILGAPYVAGLSAENIGDLARLEAAELKAFSGAPPDKLDGLLDRMITTDLVKLAKELSAKVFADLADRFAPEDLRTLTERIDAKLLRKLPESVDANALAAIKVAGLETLLKSPGPQATGALFDSLQPAQVKELLDNYDAYKPYLDDAAGIAALLGAMSVDQGASLLEDGRNQAGFSLARAMSLLALSSGPPALLALLSFNKAMKASMGELEGILRANNGASAAQIKAAVCGKLIDDANNDTIDGARLTLLLKQNKASVVEGKTFKTLSEKEGGGDTTEYIVYLWDSDNNRMSTDSLWVVHLHREWGSSATDAPVAAHIKRYAERKQKEAKRIPVGTALSNLCRGV